MTFSRERLSPHRERTALADLDLAIACAWTILTIGCRQGDRDEKSGARIAALAAFVRNALLIAATLVGRTEL
jgi:hypothetical protein